MVYWIEVAVDEDDGNDAAAATAAMAATRMENGRRIKRNAFWDRVEVTRVEVATLTLEKERVAAFVWW